MRTGREMSTLTVIESVGEACDAVIGKVDVVPAIGSSKKHQVRR